jgi:microcystin-dependent protein
VSEQFVAEIRIFAGNFPPKGWAFCDGQVLPLSQNTALFSLLGTNYGGDGKSTFALPDLQGMAPLQPGQGPGLSEYFLGETSGEEAVTLLATEIPVHGHSLMITNQPGEDAVPAGEVLGRSVGASLYQTTTNQNMVAMGPEAVGLSGASLPHNNLQPYLTLSFCIALQGVFPPRP